MHPKSQFLAALAFVAVSALSVMLSSGCASGNYATPPPEAAAPPVADRLQPGDVVQITFPGATNMNSVQRIPMDGALTLPFVAPIPATGKTVTELQAEILKRYEAQLQLKEVSVAQLSSAAVFYVSGAVLRPGKLPLERPITALEAIMEAGGPDPNRGKMDDVRVIRYEEGKQVTYRLDLKRALQGQGPPPFYLKPFDVVHVPAKTFNF